MESISRVGSLLETARDLTLEAARDAGPRRSTRALPPAQIKKLLDSRNERDILDGLRRVLTMQCANPPLPTLTFFPAVVKTLSNNFASVRPLVYNYIARHAEQDPDTALLSINTIQKSLSDPNPRVRAMALRTMASIKVPVISQIVSLAIKKGISDLSPIVRKTAAFACIKCTKLDPNTRPQVEEYLGALMSDKQYYVVGAAIQAFEEICPERIDLLHPIYRKLCRMIMDMDEWGQLAVLRVLTKYCRNCFPQRTKRIQKVQTQEEQNRSFYEDLDIQKEATEYEEVDLVDDDLRLLLKSIQQLLQSRNPAVIISVARAYLYLAPATHLPNAIGPLIALLRTPQDVQDVALYNIVQVCMEVPQQFVPHFRHFLIRLKESPQTSKMKLEVLTLIFPHCSREVQDLVLAELEHFSHGNNAELVRESVRAIGRCAQSSNTATSRRCLSLLLKQIHGTDKTLVGEAIEVVRQLIQRSPEEHQKTVVRLAKNLDVLTSSTARASIIWLVGEYAAYDPEKSIAADVLRVLVKGYANEQDAARMQIVLLAAKVYLLHLNTKNDKLKALDALKSESDPTNLHSDDAEALSSANDETPHPIELLYQHTMLLARYTPSYDLRDRARLFRALLAIPSSTEMATLLLLAPKPVPQAPSPSETRKGLKLGTSSLVIGEEAGIHGIRGYEAIPDWVTEGDEPDPKLRKDGSEDVGGSGSATAKPVAAGQLLDRALETDLASGRKHGASTKEKTLDDWLDEESGDASDGENEESEEETESEEDYEDDEDDDESDDEEEEDDDEESDDEEDEKARLVQHE